MKRIVLIFLMLLGGLSACSLGNKCPSEQVVNYLNKYFDIIENVFLANYISKEFPEEAPENEIAILSYRSEFQHFSDPPVCAYDHYDSVIRIIDLFLDEIVNKKNDPSISDKVNTELITIDMLTQELILKVDDEILRTELDQRKQEVSISTIQDKAKVFFIQQGLIEPSDEQKEEVVMNFLYKEMSNDPQSILHDFIDYIELDIVDKNITFYVRKEITAESEFQDIFTHLFFAALANAINSEEEFIWNVDTIGVVFIDNENNWVDIFMDRDNFQKFFANPENLFSLLSKQTSSSQ
jgi:hypothetical protein